MNYQVLARKWRPHSFSEIVGQQHVVRSLTHALDQDRVHHALLFTGTRGVGKTTLARIFAKSLNCERGVSATPCGECGSCKEVDQGRFVDLIEIDAASRTKVEDTRELLDNVQYAPTRGRYKVYLIDEVHMLSNHSFNALLKTLEEPPQHVKFILATTDPQRLPVTVLSRCLQFNLKRLSERLIADHLATILEQENISYEAAALKHIAHAGEGSMRDALTLLDQAIAFGSGAVQAANVATMLGTLAPHHVIDLLDALAAGDGQRLLQGIAELDESAPDYDHMLADLLAALQRIALIQAIPDCHFEDDGPERDDLHRLATCLSPEDVQLYYQFALQGRRDLPWAPSPRGGFEMVLLRMLCFTTQEQTSERAVGIPPAPAVPAAAAPTRNTSTAAGTGRAHDLLQAMRKRQGKADTEPRDVTSDATAQAFVPQSRQRCAETQRDKPDSAEMPAEKPDVSVAKSVIPPEKPDVPVAKLDIPPAKPAAMPARRETAVNVQSLDETAAISAYSEYEQIAATTPADSVDEVEISVPARADAAMAATCQQGTVISQEAAPQEIAPAHPAPATIPQNAGQISTEEGAATVDLTDWPSRWSEIVGALSLQGIALQLAKQTVIKEVRGAHLTLALAQNHSGLCTDSTETRLREALSRFAGCPLKLTIRVDKVAGETPAAVDARLQSKRQQAAEHLIQDDPNVQALQATFNASIRAGSVQPLDE